MQFVKRGGGGVEGDKQQYQNVEEWTLKSRFVTEKII